MKVYLAKWNDSEQEGNYGLFRTKEEAMAECQEKWEEPLTWFDNGFDGLDNAWAAVVDDGQFDVWELEAP